MEELKHTKEVAIEVAESTECGSFFFPESHMVPS